MGRRRADYDPSLLFTLHVRLSGGLAIIKAWEAPYSSQTYSTHTKLDCELRWHPKGAPSGGETIFARGDTYCGIPGHHTLDGSAAKECVLSLFALKPGDTDSDYFEGYSNTQLEWVTAHGEELSMVAEDRYGAP
jgi:hypothetical protein